MYTKSSYSYVNKENDVKIFKTGVDNYNLPKSKWITVYDTKFYKPHCLDCFTEYTAVYEILNFWYHEIIVRRSNS